MAEQFHFMGKQRTELYQISTKCSDRACQKWWHGVRVVERENNLKRPLGSAQRVSKQPKVGQNGPKIAKIDIPPIHFKNRKTTHNLVMKHVFWACWIQRTCMQVLGWVVGWGATCGGGKRVKTGQNQVPMEVIEKNKENQKYSFCS